MIPALAIIVHLTAAAASSNAISVQTVMGALTEKMRLRPKDKFSIMTEEGSALVEYEGVKKMPAPDEYAIIISVRRW